MLFLSGSPPGVRGDLALSNHNHPGTKTLGLSIGCGIACGGVSGAIAVAGLPAYYATPVNLGCGHDRNLILAKAFLPLSLLLM